MLFNQAITTFDAVIADIERQISELQTKLSEVQSHKQQVLSVEQQWESAIAQLEQAKASTMLVCPELLETGKAGVMAVFNDAIALPHSSDNEPDTLSDTNPVEPEPDTSEAIDVTATSEAFEPDTTESDTQPDTPSDNTTQPRPLASVGSSGFNPSTADLDALKRWGRSHQDDDETRTQGSLTRRATWESAAKQILGRIAVEQQ